MSVLWETVQRDLSSGLSNSESVSTRAQPCKNLGSIVRKVSLSTRTHIRLVVPFSGWLLIAVLIGIGIRDLGIWAGVAGALTVVFSVGFHELAHVIAALAADVPVHEAGLKFIGAYTRRQPAKHRRQEIAIAAAGPLASVLLFFVLFFVPKIGPWLSAWNLGIVVMNLAPFPGTDGHRIFKTIFSRGRLKTRPW